MGVCCTIDSAAQARRWQAADRHACGHERGDVYPQYRLPMALPSEGLSAVQHGPPPLHLVALRWCAGSHSPCACREKAERDASPTAAIIDSQSVKNAEKGGLHRSAWLRCGQEDQGQE